MRMLMMAAAIAVTVNAPRPAEAHFLWIEMGPGANPAVARIVFGETPDTGEPELVARVAQARAFADGKPLSVTKTQDCLEAKLPATRSAAVDAVCDYGVVTKRGPAFLLRYAARTQARLEAADSGRGEPAESPRLVWIAAEGTPENKAEVKALWRGKPVANATVKVFGDDAEPSEVATDAEGRVPGLQAGKWNALLLKVVEPQSGSRDGQDYKEVRHYATLTVSRDQTEAVAAGNADSDSADALLERAHRARANWGPNFPGFTADLTVAIDNAKVSGKLDVAADGTITLELPAGPAKDWARTQLRSLVMHRGIDGPTEMETGATFLEPAGHPLGRLIKLPDDRMGSAYRVKGDEILEVNRVMKGKRFSNRILANHRNAEGKILPLAYTVSHWDNTSGKLDRVEDFHDTWTRVAHLDLPRTHTQIVTSDDTSSVRQLALSNHHLKGLAPAGAK